MSNNALNNSELQHYARQLSLPDFNQQQQLKLKHSKILIVGMGGLGCPVSTYLAGAGVGTLGLIDDDIVAKSNLQRQPLYGQASLGQAKVKAAKKRLHDLNPHIHINATQQTLNISNAEQLIKQYDMVIDGSDNLSARYLINDVCVKLAKPFVYGAVYQYSGQTCLFTPANGCYRCLFPQGAPQHILSDCNSGGVIGILPGIIGLLQATQAIKHITQLTPNPANRLLQFDAASLSLNTIEFQQNEHCPACQNSADLQLNATEYCTPLNVISAHALNDTLNAKPAQWQVLDIREHDEVAQSPTPQIGTAKHIHIPLSALRLEPDSAQQTLNSDAPLLIICQTGQRAEQAATLLLAAPFSYSNKKITVLRGGLQAWLDS